MAETEGVRYREALLERLGADEPSREVLRHWLAVVDCVSEALAHTLVLTVLACVREGEALRHLLGVADCVSETVE